MNRVFFTQPMVKLLTVLAVVVGFVIYVYLASGLPAPREQDRVVTRNGTFSIIKPRGWEADIRYGGPHDSFRERIVLTPQRSVGMETRITAARLSQPQNMDELLSRPNTLRGEFQSRQAVLSEKRSRKEYFWWATFERDGQWYEVGIRLARPEDLPSSDYWPFLTSFRASAATQPATAPYSLRPLLEWHASSARR
ncbi:hypothetical protein [Fontivita pretiosa]|jgi:hypothetical protein|uniref:hypothetical protein n=1 Tax=Fontivita pretiosa TaxID=2989684 RepID=UPI003D177D70